MQHIGAHIAEETKSRRPARDPDPAGRRGKKDRATERGELMQYFLDKLNRSRVQDGLVPMTMGRLGRTLVGIPTKDLYYLKSVCDQSNNFSKKFWWEVKPRKEETPEEARTKEQAAWALYKKKRWAERQDIS